MLAMIVGDEKVMIEMSVLRCSSCSVGLGGVAEVLCGTERGVKGFQ